MRLMEVCTSNRMHEVAWNRAAFHKSKAGSLELINPLVPTPGRGFTGNVLYIDYTALAIDPFLGLCQEPATEVCRPSPVAAKKQFNYTSFPKSKMNSLASAPFGQAPPRNDNSKAAIPNPIILISHKNRFWFVP